MPAELARRSLLTLELRVLLATAGLFSDALVVHGASFVAPDGRGALFLGASGSGKSSMARRLPGWTLLADDASIVFRSADGTFHVSGTPVPGKEAHPRLHRPSRLGALFALRKCAPAPGAVPLTPEETFAETLPRTHVFTSDPELTERAVELVQQLGEGLSAFRLESDLHHQIEPLVAECLERGEC